MYHMIGFQSHIRCVCHTMNKLLYADRILIDQLEVQMVYTIECLVYPIIFRSTEQLQDVRSVWAQRLHDNNSAAQWPWDGDRASVASDALLRLPEYVPRGIMKWSEVSTSFETLLEYPSRTSTASMQAMVLTSTPCMKNRWHCFKQLCRSPLWKIQVTINSTAGWASREQQW